MAQAYGTVHAVSGKGARRRVVRTLTLMGDWSQPTSDERDERVDMHGQDPEAVLRAFLRVRPGDDPDEDDVPPDPPKS